MFFSPFTLCVFCNFFKSSFISYTPLVDGSTQLFTFIDDQLAVLQFNLLTSNNLYVPTAGQGQAIN